MMEVESSYSDFISCDRTGRRNAVPDVQGDSEPMGLPKLAGAMGELALEGAEGQAEVRTADKEASSSPRAAMAPPHLECDLTRAGWTGAAPWTRSPGVALSSVFQASRSRPKGGQGLPRPPPWKALCPHPQAPRPHHLPLRPGTFQDTVTARM